MAEAPTTRITIHSRLSEIPPVVQRILEQVQARGYDEDSQFAIRLALDEALSNAIRHGNCGDETKKVEIQYSVDDQRFYIQICDEGCGFHPNGVPDPTLDENLDKPCGRGVMLMRAYMTEVRFNASGNCVTMTKDRCCKQPNRP